MPNPTSYTPAYSFSGYQASNPTIPLPADKVDAELAAIDVALDSTQTALNEIRRSDGKLTNQIVGVDSLSTAVLALFSGDPSPRGAWAAGTPYEVGDLVTVASASYLCATAHTSSAAFAADNALGFWTLLAGLVAGAGSIGTTELADGAVTLAKLAANSVDATKIADGSVGTAELADGAVTSAKIADGTIATGDLADGAITTAKIAANAVDSTKLATDAATQRPTRMARLYAATNLN